MILLGPNGAKIRVGADLEGSSVLANRGGVYEISLTGTIPTDKVVYQANPSVITDKNGFTIFANPTTARGRGNSTWDAPKKPFKIRTDNNTRTPFNFAPSRDWALMADYFDGSYLRSTIGYEIGRRATGRWMPQSRHVRVTWNGVYQGLYRWSETADVQPGRVDIRDMSNTGDTTGNPLTGPYFLEINKPLDDDGWTTARGSMVLYDNPDVLGNAAHETYIQTWIDTFETALVTGVEADFLGMIDISSWVDWYLLMDSVKVMDSAFFKSIKFYKDQDPPNGTGKIHMYPPWDFDLALGTQWNNGLQGQPVNTGGFHTRTGPNAPEPPTRPNWMYYAWSKSPTFRAAVRAKWASSFKPVLDGIGTYIDQEAALIAPYIAEDRAKWWSSTAVPEHHQPGWIKDWLATRTAGFNTAIAFDAVDHYW